MNEDDVDRVIVGFSQSDHFAEGAALVISGASGLGENPDACRVVFLDPTLCAGNLIRQREVVLLLPGGRNPSINENALALKIVLHAAL
ncbi:hypothetical protein IH86_14595 [Sphingobium yanoikuyae]|nr:hypothetical protein [Sphingobium yanoikuyae]KFD27361.1 hypothetical protein IH86_14595 [Sphingobium yanoikuyae]MDV3479998.1 hypothetical protein [Sphingobium yanoikuyae]